MIVQTLGAFLAVFSFGLILELPRKRLVLAGTIGAIGWMIYLLADRISGSPATAAFVSSLAVSLSSHGAARVKKAPVTVFLVAGILPSVPGASIYRSVSCVINNEPQLSIHYLVETLQIAGAIALAVFLMDSLFRLGRESGKPKKASFP